MKQLVAYVSLITTLLTCYNSMVAVSQSNIYIENHYGAPIKFKKGTADSNASEVAVDNQARVLVGPVDSVTQISIRTTGKGSRFVSYFTELTQQMTHIKNDQNNAQYRNKDAIIIIKPSRSFQSWDIAINWESTGQVLQELDEDFRQEAEQAHFIEKRRKVIAEREKREAVTASKKFASSETKLANIIHGSLGADYAEKARAINDYDYTKATKKGLLNLRTSLLKRIQETLEQTYHKVSRRKGEWIAPDLATEQELKDAIDMLSRSLEKYKAHDNI